MPVSFLKSPRSTSFLMPVEGGVFSVMKVSFLPSYCFHLSASLAKVRVGVSLAASLPLQPNSRPAEAARPPATNARRVNGLGW